MPAGEGNPGLGAGLPPSIHYLLGYLGSQLVNGPAEYGDRHEGSSTHGVDVANCIGCSDLAEFEGIIYDGHEKIGGGDDGRTVSQVVDRGIVTGLIPHQQARIRHNIQPALQDFVEQFGGDFATTAGTVTVIGHTNGGFGHLLERPVI